MDFTGERLVLGQTDIELEIEHINRYKFALQFAKGKKVLDAACGTGYGSAILSREAEEVVGIDISEEAIIYAKERFGNNNISFIQASIDELPFEDNCFDVVVSFETIEHVSETIQNYFLAEIKRVLTPNGILIISTPNHDVYKNRGENHFHIKELNIRELKTLLESKFLYTNLLSQQFEVCNIISGEQEALAESTKGVQPRNAEYLIAVCSDKIIKNIKNQAYIRIDNKLKSLMEWAISTHKLNEENNKAIEAQHKEIEILKSKNSGLNQKIINYFEQTSQISIDEQQSLQNVENILSQIFDKINADLQQKDDFIQQIDSELKHTEEELKNKDIELKNKENEIELKLNEIHELNGIVNKKELENSELKQVVLNKEGHINILLESDRELTMIKGSRAWKLVQIIWKITGAVMPQGSKRRLFARLIRDFFKHPISFLKKLNIQNVKKFFMSLKREGAKGALSRVDNVLVGINQKTTPLKMEKVATSKAITDYSKLSFKTHKEPLVSIVIPVYNQFDYTYNCLKSIFKNSGDISYEIIIANDCSTDMTTEIDQIVSNIRVVTNEENLRFLKNCNNAVKYTKGKYILLLNNDTQVQENWLAPLVELIEKDDSIGMVGSKLVYANGKLQEAGGIVWNDASAWNYGNKRDPSEPEYNYVKEVDYISGACIMISKALWNEIGGFDERFAPAYCEDSDLAFEVRKRGYKVVYQPKSVVVHYEGISNGTNISSGQKAYQIINQKKFLEKWRDVLEKDHFSNGNNVFWARDRSKDKKTILFIDHYVPTYDKDAGSRTIYQYLKLVVEMGYNIKFIGDNFYKLEPYASELEQVGIEILYGSYYLNHWKNWVRDNGNYLDVVFMNRPHISIKYIDFINKNTNARIIYNVCDLHFLREKRQYEITKSPSLLESSRKWEKIEYSIMEKADVVFTLSTYEKSIINAHFNFEKAIICPVFIYNKFVDLEVDPTMKKDLIFAGGFTHTPNVDGIMWFIEEIFPTIQSKIPNIKLNVIGSNVPEEIKDIKNNGIIIHGYVSDEVLEELYHKCRICVIPLRYGAGVKGKTIEAMYHQMAIVSTSTGLEGLEKIEDYIIAQDSVREFADEVIDLYNNEDRIKMQGKNNINFVRRHFSKDSAKELFERVFRE